LTFFKEHLIARSLALFIYLFRKIRAEIIYLILQFIFYISHFVWVAYFPNIGSFNLKEAVNLWLKERLKDSITPSFTWWSRERVSDLCIQGLALEVLPTLHRYISCQTVQCIFLKSIYRWFTQLFTIVREHFCLLRLKKNLLTMEHKRNSVIALYLAGKSNSAIVKKLQHLKVNEMFVFRTINRYKETSSIKKTPWRWLEKDCY